MTLFGLRWFKLGALAVAAVLALGFAIGSLAGSEPAADRARGRAFRDGALLRQESADTRAARREAAPSTAEDRAAIAQSSGFGDRVVRTAELTLEVREGRFDDAWKLVNNHVLRRNWQVLSSSTGTGGGPVPILEDRRAERDGLFGDITIRVPTEAFDAARAELSRFGEVRGDVTNAQDVTQEFVDLRSRLRNLRAQQERLLVLMRRARTVGETLEVQQRLQEVQGQIEEHTGRIRYLEARTDFATITLHIAEPGAAVLSGDEGPSFAKAWETALVGLERMGTAAMIAGLWLLPFALIALVVLGALRMRRPAPQA